jgi:anti-sigma-K factor RskA
MKENMDERLRDLLCDQAAIGLTEDEKRELAELTQGANGGMDAQTLELTAAAIALADTNIDERLPAHLEARILADAEKHFATDDIPAREAQWVESKPRGSFLNWFGWAVAAAACVVLGVNIYLTRTPQYAGGPPPTPTPTILTPAQQREQLLAAPEVTRADWTKGNMPELASVSGDVVWSDAKQAGYLRLKGLPVNDANKESYQLWIYDETQSEKTPIDGGVFNITADGEVIIPITAKLRARNPKTFAITIEKPGGVVVSKGDKVAALAPVKPSQA